MDRGYIDFMRLYTFHLCGAFFVIRAKSNMNFHRLYSYPVDKSTGLKCDQAIILTGVESSVDYPEKLRSVRYYDNVTNKDFNFLTKIFMIPPITTDTGSIFSINSSKLA